MIAFLGRLPSPHECFGDDPALRRRWRQLALRHDLDRQRQPQRAIAFAQEESRLPRHRRGRYWCGAVTTSAWLLEAWRSSPAGRRGLARLGRRQRATASGPRQPAAPTRASPVISTCSGPTKSRSRSRSLRPPARRSARLTRPRPPFVRIRVDPEASPRQPSGNPCHRWRFGRRMGEGSASTPRPLDPQRPQIGHRGRTGQIAAVFRDLVPV